MSALKKTETKKQLESRYTKLDAEVKAMQSEIDHNIEVLQGKIKKLSSIKKQIDKINIEPSVSEHAILRYLERKFNLDIEDIKNQILTDDIKVLIQNLNSGKFPIGDGRKAIVKNKCIVSII